MAKIKLTEKQLKTLVSIMKEDVEKTDVHIEDNVTEVKPKEPNALAKKMYNQVNLFMGELPGRYTLKEKKITEDIEDDKLKKTWKWKSNDGQVEITANIDIKMNK